MTVMVNENFPAAPKQEDFAGSAGPELPKQAGQASSDFNQTIQISALF
jgi:hypothetical protein